MRTLLRTSIEPSDFYQITKEFDIKKDTGRITISIPKKASSHQWVQVFDRGYDVPSSDRFHQKSAYKDDTDVIDISVSVESEGQGEFVLAVLQYDDEKRILNDNKAFKVKKGQSKFNMTSVRHIRAKSFKVRINIGSDPLNFTIDDFIIWQKSALSEEYIEWSRIQKVREKVNLLDYMDPVPGSHEVIIHNPFWSGYDFSKERMGYSHLISVIVPIYNTSEYLPKCIDSLLAQTIKDIEIILINDGSKDNSLEIMKSYQSRYPEKIKIIDQENQGQGAARNEGIKASTGRYIMFLDSDDEYVPNACEMLFWVAKKYCCDMVVGRIAWNLNSKIIPQESHEKKLVKYLSRRFINIRNDQSAMFMNIVCTLYSSQLLKENNIMFPEGVFWEDMPFALQAWYYSKNIGVCSEIVYLRTMRDDSTTKTYNFKLINDKIEISKMISQRFNEYGLHSMYKYFDWVIKDIDERIELIHSEDERIKALKLWSVEKKNLTKLRKYHEIKFLRNKN
ncbi:MAG: glycosyltransferase family 2 protein [Methanomassiliicoccales archaeon]|nr:MAG: glycosyltransferase family 2 protein [Methanomassiliicoccales archaeon]